MNLCCACGQDFASVTLFDAHRVGKHQYAWSPEQPDGRRCFGVDELEARGWTLDERGRWCDPARADRFRNASLTLRGPRRGPVSRDEGLHLEAREAA